MEPLKILHIASFHGNIGDNANHAGFRPWFESVLGRPSTWHDLEIREFYWKERQWDSGFVDYANEFDLVVIGGGNYFELWVETSPTGTSIAIPPDLYRQMEVPVFFNALGVDEGQGASAGAVEKFQAFVDCALEEKGDLISVRNDGAHATLTKHLGASYGDRVNTVPDGGFFSSEAWKEEGSNSDGKTLIGINIACDMPEVRFQGFGVESPLISFCEEMAQSLELVSEQIPDSELLLVPHIYSDVRVVSLILDRLPDRLRRNRVRVLNYGSGEQIAEGIVREYAQCDLVLGMRFHANVCALAYGVNTLGLECYPQITKLYGELGLEDRLIDVSKPGFKDGLASRVVRELANQTSWRGIIGDVSARLKYQRGVFENRVREWFRQKGLILCE